MSLEVPPQNRNHIEVLKTLSTEQHLKIDNLHNKAGHAPLGNMIEVYIEDNPTDQKLMQLLSELKLRLPDTEDFNKKYEEILKLIE